MQDSISITILCVVAIIAPILYVIGNILNNDIYCIWGGCLLAGTYIGLYFINNISHYRY